MNPLDLLLVGLSLGAGALLLLDCRRRGKCGQGACGQCPVSGACGKRITRRQRIRNWLHLRLQAGRTVTRRMDSDRR